MIPETESRLETKIDKLSDALQDHMKEENKLQLATAKSITGLLYTIVGHTVVGLGFIGVFSWHYLNNMAVDTKQQQAISTLTTKVEVLETRVNKLEAKEPITPLFP